MRVKSGSVRRSGNVREKGRSVRSVRVRRVEEMDEVGACERTVEV